MKPLAHQPAKKKASSNPVIPQKLSYEKSEKELKDVVQKDVKNFFEKSKKATRSEGEPRETVLLPTSRSSKKEGGPEKAGISKDPAKIRLRSLSPSHLRRRRKRLEQGNVLHNSDNNRNNQSPLLSFVMNMVQT